VKQAAPVEVPAPVELDVIPLHARLRDNQPLPSLDLGADDADNLPTRVRVFERDGNVICVSDPAIYDGVTRTASLKLPLPPSLAAAVRRGVLDDYRFEALVAHRWIRVRLIQAATPVSRDGRGRMYRPA
jgi:hypothetical protein